MTTDLMELASRVAEAKGEPDMTWFLIAVERRNDRGQASVVILDYAPGWQPHHIEFHWEDTFDSDPPCHLDPGAYLWSDFTVGFWDEDDALSVKGGTFTPYTARAHQGGSHAES